ncbi:site-specific integrase [Terrihabitans sp. B22-R8]|uniref:site-specific integrase n=1 Tax=Terrihabitans sp. B22-R8 TaxID=3425128 RepID=UPI00403D52EC
MRYDAIRQVLKEHFARLLQEEKSRIDESGPLSGSDLTAVQNGLQTAEQAVATGESISLAQSDEPIIKAFAERYDLDLQPGSRAYGLFSRELAVSYRSYCQAVLDYNSSLSAYSFNAQTTASEAQAVPDAEGPTISELVQRFVDENRLGKQWGPRTLDEKQKHFALLYEIVGQEAQAAALTPDSVQRVKDTLKKYPVNRMKNPVTRSLTLEEALELPGVDKIDVKTLNKYLQTFSSMFEWARQNRYVPENPFSGMAVRANRKAEGNKPPFTNDQMDLIISTLISKPTGKPYRKWGTLIAAFTGARLNEIAQLSLKDIREQDRILCFDLTDEGEDQRLKNAASKRLVPVHASLIELGFSEFLQERRASGELKLFPGLTYDPKNGWGRSLGRWVNDEFLDELGLKKKGVSFHTFRHTVITRLLQSKIDQPIVQAIVGHTRGGVTQQHYFGEGYTVQQLQDALHKLPYQIPRSDAGATRANC